MFMSDEYAFGCPCTCRGVWGGGGGGGGGGMEAEYKEDLFFLFLSYFFSANFSSFHTETQEKFLGPFENHIFD